MGEEKYEVQAAYREMWEHFIDAYLVEEAIPVTYRRDLYPWFEDHQALIRKLVTIFGSARCDSDMLHLLDMTAQYAKPLGMDVITTPLLKLPFNWDVQRVGTAVQVQAYLRLDKFIDSLSLVMNAWAFGGTRPSHLDFLRDPQNHVMFAHLGTFMRQHEITASKPTEMIN